MTSTEIRKAFLDFFESKGHKIVPSAPIVVKNDPTLMFINSGMAPFKNIFLGNEPIKYKRVADTQKCLRVSGKHNDLEEVGVDTYHHTMFEMLGNWSFGDYFKKEAIEWSWELLTKVYGLEKDRLYVTVFEGDEKEKLAFDTEAYNEWKKWIAEDRILKGNKKDNFWEMGETGPCGPCSEMHIDLRSEEERKKVDGKTLVNTSHPQVIEIWNDVFIEFERKADGSLVPLEKRHVDTGMGFERLTMAIQGKSSSYDTDIFQPLIQEVSKKCKINYGGKVIHEPQNFAEHIKFSEQPVMTDVAMRVISDHVRTIAFTIADGQLPSNIGAGYVVRRILRRAVRYGYSYLNFDSPFLYELIPVLSHQFAFVFPELEQHKDFLSNVIREEETTFFKTLKTGIAFLEKYFTSGLFEGQKDKIMPAPVQKDDTKETQIKTNTGGTLTLTFRQIVEEFASHEKKIVSGLAGFLLYDTQGFPIDLTKLVAAEKGWTVDETGFDKWMALQKDRSRSASSTEQSDWINVGEDVKTDFIGYDFTEADAHVVKYRSIKQKDKELFQVVLDKTPFYAESGGQVGDKGLLDFAGEQIEVEDTKKENDLIVHIVKKLPTKIEVTVHAKVKEPVRISIMRNHSATHLLHAALRKKLGTHVEQKGSLVDSHHLRFDFSHPSKLSENELNAVEEAVNDAILKNIPLSEKRNVPIAEAKDMGAMMLFGEKYGEFVRVITFDEKFSRELCGGTHVKSTGEIGLFTIFSESAIGAGVRRIEAVTGKGAYLKTKQESQELKEIAATLKAPDDLIVESLRKLQHENEELKKENERLHDIEIARLADVYLSTSVEALGKVKFLALLNLKGITIENMGRLGILLSQKLTKDFVIVMSANINSKDVVHLRVAPSLSINGNQLLKELAPGIKGGGSPDFVRASAGSMSEVEDLILKLKQKFA